MVDGYELHNYAVGCALSQISAWISENELELQLLIRVLDISGMQ